MVHQMRPVDQLRQILMDKRGPDNDQVKAFFKLHKVILKRVTFWVWTGKVKGSLGSQPTKNVQALWFCAILSYSLSRNPYFLFKNTILLQTFAPVPIQNII